MKSNVETVSGWGRVGRYQGRVVVPNNLDDLVRLVQVEKSLTLRAGGCSAGDVIMNRSGTVVDLRAFSAIRQFDPDAGTVTAQGGARLAEILDIVLPRGWTLSGVPGSPRVTVAGAISGNVHGKDSFFHGSFGRSIVSMTLLTANGQLLELPRDNPTAFEAVIGGLGLLGVIVEATIRIWPLPGRLLSVQSQPFADLDELKTALDTAIQDNHLAFGWVDSFSTRGRGLLETARWTGPSGGVEDHRSIADRPYRLFGILPYRPIYPILKPFMGRFSMRIYNRLKIRADTGSTQFPEFGDFYYPQAFSVPEIAGLLPQGYLETQLFIPGEDAFEVFRSIHDHCRRNRLESWICSVKRLRSDPYPLSFSGEGYTMSIVLPARVLRCPTFETNFRWVVDMVADQGGKIHLIKDQLLRRDDVTRMYPGLDSFLEVKKSLDPEERFSSDLYRRLLRRS